jgi:hypothetical protein
MIYMGTEDTAWTASSILVSGVTDALIFTSFQRGAAFIRNQAWRFKLMDDTYMSTEAYSELLLQFLFLVNDGVVKWPDFSEKVHHFISKQL